MSSQHPPSNSSSDMLLAAIIIVGLIISASIWRVSEEFGLDFFTTAKVIGLIVGFTATAVFVWWKTPISVTETWFVLVALYWASFWPAFDYRSSKASFASLDESFGVTQWYASWYMEYGLFAAILAGGYFLTRKGSEMWERSRSNRY